MCITCGCDKMCNCAGCAALAAKFSSEPISDNPPKTDEY